MRLDRVVRSAGFRLGLVYAGLFGGSVLLLSAIIYAATVGLAWQELEAVVAAELTSLAEEHRAGGRDLLLKTIHDRVDADLIEGSYYLLQAPDGARLAGNLPAMAPQVGWIELPAESLQAQGVPVIGFLLAEGRILGDGSFLLVGEDAFRLAELKQRIVVAFGIAFVVTVLLALAGGAALSAGALGRIDAITQTARRIMEGHLADRIPTRDTGDDLDRLAVSLNQMLDRIQTLMRSLEQVTSDLAHDLRTPLGRLRQRLETARSKASSLGDYESATDTAVAELDRILQTFTALLRIAQIEAGQRRSGFAAVDLSHICETIREVYETAAEERRQRLGGTIASAVKVHGDGDLLTQLIANLVENAILHSPPGASIELALHGSDPPSVVVADTGPGIPETEWPNVFKRFYRLEKSRTTPGSGLGLSLAAAIAELHGITIELANNRPGLRVRLRFPIAGT